MGVICDWTCGDSRVFARYPKNAAIAACPEYNRSEMRKRRRAISTPPDTEHEKAAVEKKIVEYYSALTSEEAKEQTLWGNFAHDEACEIAAGCPRA